MEPLATTVTLRIRHGGDVAMGPGKAMLLREIAATGSISGAARAIGMSYRRAWLLVETMNGAFRVPLVETATGGRSGGGARVTEAGQIALARYEALAASVERDVRTAFTDLLR
jgi:molybdate transport system regulatory protein